MCLSHIEKKSFPDLDVETAFQDDENAASSCLLHWGPISHLTLQEVRMGSTFPKAYTHLYFIQYFHLLRLLFHQQSLCLELPLRDLSDRLRIDRWHFFLYDCLSFYTPSFGGFSWTIRCTNILRLGIPRAMAQSEALYEAAGFARSVWRLRSY